MPNFRDIAGSVFGRLTVLCPVGQRNHKTLWKCLCNCGNSKIVPVDYLTSGDTTSCGCLRKELNAKLNYKHGLRKHPIYPTWLSMKDRCFNPKNQDYCSYGGRGITVCSIWKDDFKFFYDWAISSGWQKGLTIERIDVDGNYDPGNCKWIPALDQAHNRTNNYRFYLDGEFYSLKQLVEKFSKIPYKTVSGRLKDGWGLKEALHTPIKTFNHRGGNWKKPHNHDVIYLNIDDVI